MDEKINSELVIIDSLSIGCNGGDLYTAEVITPVLNEAKKTYLSIVFIDHPAKNADTAYGSVFKENQVRSYISLLKDRDTGVVKAELKKENFAGSRPPFSFKLNYSACRDLPGRDEYNVIEFEVVETIETGLYKYEKYSTIIDAYMRDNEGKKGTWEEIFRHAGGEKDGPLGLNITKQTFRQNMGAAAEDIRKATSRKNWHPLQIFRSKDESRNGKPYIYTIYKNIGPNEHKKEEEELKEDENHDRVIPP